MFDRLIAFASNHETQSEFKAFLQEYHKTLTSKHEFKPLKLGRALHAAAETMGEESWHHISGQEAVKTPETWVVRVHDERCKTQYFDSEESALLWFWTEKAALQLKVLGIYEQELRGLGMDSEYPILNLSNLRMLAKKFHSIKEEVPDMLFSYDFYQQ